MSPDLSYHTSRPFIARLLAKTGATLARREIDGRVSVVDADGDVWETGLSSSSQIAGSLKSLDALIEKRDNEALPFLLDGVEPGPKQSETITVRLSRREADALINSHMESNNPSLVASAAVSRIYEALDARRIDELEADALSIPTSEEIGERTANRVRSLVSEMGRAHLAVVRERDRVRTGRAL